MFSGPDLFMVKYVCLYSCFDATANVADVTGAISDVLLVILRSRSSNFFPIFNKLMAFCTDWYAREA